MRWFDQLCMALLSLFRRQNQSAQLNSELQFHLEQEIRENIARGLSPEEARYAALRLFGNPTLISEQARSTWSGGRFEKLVTDLRHGARGLIRSPGFALAAILVMALGIGATTSLFTIVHAVLLKPLPFREPSQLVMVAEHFRAGVPGTDPYNVVAPADFRDWREKTHGFQDMAAWRYYGFTISGEHAEFPESLRAAAGTSNLFSLLGVPLAVGRSFTAQEDQPGGNHVAVLTWSLYQRRFAGDPSIVGKQIRLDSNAYQVVGVLPPSFTYPDAEIQIWVPYASTFDAQMWNTHAAHQSHVVARLRPGVSAEAATHEVSAVQYQEHLAHMTEPVAEDAVWRPMIDDVVKDVKKPLIVLLCAVGCVLLIACLNVSNLLIARSAARRKEFAVRSAMGGSRLTLIAEQMTESLLICILGASVGVLLSFLTTGWLAGHWQDLPRASTIHVDATVLAFSVVLAVAAALLAGLLPAISATGAGILGVLQESSRSVGGSTSRAALRKVLLIGEIALTVVLLVCAGLLFKSFLNLRSANLGCATDRVLTMRYALPEKQYDTRAKVAGFHEALLERVRRLPGVSAAGLVSTAPGNGYDSDNTFTIPSHPSATFQLQDDAIYRTADPGYFSAMQIPLVRGRVFSNQERLEHDHYMVVSKKFADQFFPNEDPLGKMIHVQWDVNAEDYQIIGVVGDTLYDVTQPVKAMMYFPVLSGLPAQTSMVEVVARTTGDPLALSVPIQQQIAALDPQLAVSSVYTMQQIIGNSTAGQSFSATLVLSFAVLSLLLAAVGLYGVLSYLVSQRNAELGIRIALGAQRSQVLRLVLFDGFVPVFIGLAIGLAGGAVAAYYIRSILYGTSPLDPVVLLSMIGCLLLTALVACALPALRASRIEPMQALRTE
jgi:predicted permease